MLGVGPALGRTFRAEEDRPGGHPAVLISDSLWKRRFGADPNVLGQSITLDSVDTTIIGIMPVNFEFAPLGRSVDIWSTRTFEANNITAEQVRDGITYLIAVAEFAAAFHSIRHKLRWPCSTTNIAARIRIWWMQIQSSALVSTRCRR